jgi:hypothetical protein
MMDEQPQEPQEAPPPSAPDSEPKLLSNMKGWIAGATGLVVALGGLAATWNNIFPGKESAPAEQQAIAATPAGQGPAADTVASDAAAEPEQGAPTLYEGDDVKLEWEAEEWVLTDGDTRYHYDETYSPDENRYLAFDKANDTYLRWPIKGGMAEEGTADKQTWTNYIELYPAESPTE